MVRYRSVNPLIIMTESSLNHNFTVFARGMSIGKDCAPWLNDHVRGYWQNCGEALDEFNTNIVKNPSVNVLILPLFDGITQIKWKKDD
jgi:hypothetical protein